MAKKKGKAGGCKNCACQNEQVQDAEFTDEQKKVADILHKELLEAVERTRQKGAINVPLVVIPFAAVLSSMFVILEEQGVEHTDQLIIAFAKLLKIYTDTNKAVMANAVGNA